MKKYIVYENIDRIYLSSLFFLIFLFHHTNTGNCCILERIVWKCCMTKFDLRSSFHRPALARVYKRRKIEFICANDFDSLSWLNNSMVIECMASSTSDELSIILKIVPIEVILHNRKAAALFGNTVCNLKVSKFLSLCRTTACSIDSSVKFV